MGDFGQRAEADGPDGSRPDASTMQGSAKPWYLATDVSNSPSDPGRQRPHRGGASRGPRVWDQRTRLNVRSVTGPRHRCQHEEATWQERLPAARNQTPRFWVWAALSTVPLLFLSLLLAVWATFFAER